MLRVKFQSDLVIANQIIIFRETKRSYKGILCGRAQCHKLRMVTSSNGNIFRVTDHLCGEFTCHRAPVGAAPTISSFSNQNLASTAAPLYPNNTRSQERDRAPSFSTLRPRQNGRQFPDDIFNCIKCFSICLDSSANQKRPCYLNTFWKILNMVYPYLKWLKWSWHEWVYHHNLIRCGLMTPCYLCHNFFKQWRAACSVPRY